MALQRARRAQCGQQEGSRLGRSCLEAGSGRERQALSLLRGGPWGVRMPQSGHELGWPPGRQRLEEPKPPGKVWFERHFGTRGAPGGVGSVRGCCQQGPWGHASAQGGAVRDPPEAGLGWLGQYGGCFESPAASPSSSGTLPCPRFWLPEWEAQGIFELTHGAPKAARGSCGPHQVVAWPWNLLCGIFREVEIGPGEGEVILDQMTREITGPGDAVVGRGWLRDPISLCPQRV